VSGLINIAFGVRLLAHPFEGALAIALLLGALVFAVGARMIAGGVWRIAFALARKGERP